MKKNQKLKNGFMAFKTKNNKKVKLPKVKGRK